MAISADDRDALIQGIDSFLQVESGLEKVRKVIDGQAGVAAEIWSGMLQFGLGGLAVPQAYGGLDVGLVAVARVAERLGWSATPGPWMAHTLACLAIAHAGTAEQMESWLPSLASGERVATVALSEGPVWRPKDWALSEEAGRLTGQKDYVMAAGEADLAIVGLRGARLGLVELKHPTVRTSDFASTDLTRPVATVGFNATPVMLMPGDFAQGLVDAAAVLLAADAHGGSARAVRDIAEYSTTRVQFGRAIAEFQAVKHKLADLAAAIHHNGAFYRQAAEEVGRDSPRAPVAAALAKALVTETFNQVARSATEAYGGLGYTWEHQAHIWLRRAIFDHAWLGSPSEHNAQAAELLGW